MNNQFLDLGAPGFSVGDQFVFANDLYRGSTKVGEDGGTCTVTRLGPGSDGTIQCLGSNTLPGGQITAQGLIRFSETVSHLAITGGTGRYRNATGQIRIRDLSATELDLTFQIEQ